MIVYFGDGRVLRRAVSVEAVRTAGRRYLVLTAGRSDGHDQVFVEFGSSGEARDLAMRLLDMCEEEVRG